MGKVTFTSNTKSIPAPITNVFIFLSDLRNFESLMPDQLQQWESDENYGKFTIKGLPELDMKILERVENKSIHLVSGEESPVEFSIDCSLENLDGKTESTIVLHAELSPMLKMLAASPLQNLVNIMADKLEGQFVS
jgi:carbon monoxide dehydrogenase subunit G